MNKIFILLFLLFSFSSYAQEKEDRKVNSFSKIKVSQGIKVYLHQSNMEKIVVETSNVDIDEVITENMGDLLKIHLSGNRYRNIDVTVNVYYKNINSIDASSASSVRGDQLIKGDDFYIDVSSAASVDVMLDVYNLTVDASSSGDIKVSGRAHHISVDVSSAGSVNAFDLTAENAVADASSAGSVKIHVTKSLSADASSGGSIRYKGDPDRSKVDSSSGGSVKRSE